MSRQDLLRDIAWKCTVLHGVVAWIERRSSIPFSVLGEKVGKHSFYAAF
jgi:hypothetical protein